MLWVWRNGASWRDLPGRYGKWATVWSRFRRWQQASLWQPLLSQVRSLVDAQGELNAELNYVNGTGVRVHQHAVGGKNYTPDAEALAAAAASSALKSTSEATGTADDASLTTLRYFISPASGPSWTELAPATACNGPSCSGSVSWTPSAPGTYYPIAGVYDANGVQCTGNLVNGTDL